MKLYDFKPAPNPLRLGLFMSEKGIEIPSETIDLMKGGQFSKEYKAINPMMTVPTLVLDDGTVLTEVISMYSYLEEAYPDTPLMGNTAVERAQVLAWDHRCFAEGMMGIADVLRNSSKAFENRALPGRVNLPQVPDLVERGQKRIAGFFQNLEDHLNGREYMVGDHFTAADISAFVFINFCGWVKATVPDDCPSVKAWSERIAQRPAIAGHLASLAE